MDELPVRRCHAVPADGVEERRKVSGTVESSGSEVHPAHLGENLAVDFVVPVHIQNLALRIVIRECQLDQRGLPFVPAFDSLEKPPPEPCVNDLAGSGGPVLGAPAAIIEVLPDLRQGIVGSAPTHQRTSREDCRIPVQAVAGRTHITLQNCPFEAHSNVPT